MRATESTLPADWFAQGDLDLLSCLILIWIVESTCSSTPGRNWNNNSQRRTLSCNASGVRRVRHSDTGSQTVITRSAVSE